MGWFSVGKAGYQSPAGTLAAAGRPFHRDTHSAPEDRTQRWFFPKRRLPPGETNPAWTRTHSAIPGRAAETAPPPTRHRKKSWESALTAAGQGLPPESP